MKNFPRILHRDARWSASDRIGPRYFAVRLCLGMIFLPVLQVGGLRAAESGDSAAAGGELYARVKQASLEVLVDDHLNGSGSLVDASGLAITAAHVIGRPGNRVEVLSPVAGRRRAEVAAVDLGHDLALLRLEPRDGGYPFLPLAERLPPAGADVFLLGTPVFRHAVMFRGTVARDEPTFEYLNAGYVLVLTVAANVPSGTSGGPWVDRHGALVGVQSGVMSNNGTPVGVAFAGTGGAVRRLLETRQTAATPNAGVAIEETWQQQRDFLDRFPPRTEGLVIKVLQARRPGCPRRAETMGLDRGSRRPSGAFARRVAADRPGEEARRNALGRRARTRRHRQTTSGGDAGPAGSRLARDRSRRQGTLTRANHPLECRFQFVTSAIRDGGR